MNSYTARNLEVYLRILVDVARELDMPVAAKPNGKAQATKRGKFSGQRLFPSPAVKKPIPVAPTVMASVRWRSFARQKSPMRRSFALAVGIVI